MKRIFFLLYLILMSATGFCLFSVLPAAAQGTRLINPEQYLFPQFLQGRVGMKTGRDLNIVINYNIVTGKIVFLQKGQIYDMSEYSNVDTVFVGGKKLIPEGKVFMEVASEGRYTLLFEHTGSIQDPPKPAAYGGTSEISSSTYINNVSIGNEVYRLQKDTTLLVKSETLYWIKSGEIFERFANEKQLIKILPDMKDEIRLFIRENKLKFDNTLHVIKLLNYCNYLK